jgi:RNA recognition motif-containing protein
MKNSLYVANLAPDVTEEILTTVFEPYGAIESIQLGKDEPHHQFYAHLVMVKEKDATKARNELNGTLVNTLPLAVSPSEVINRGHLSAKQQAVVEKIAAALGETDLVPLRQLSTMIMLCGTNFAEALLAETEQVEAGEGIPTTDGTRRRTKGGVFFYLARFRMAQPLRVIIYNRKGKLPEVETETPEPQQA